MRPRALAPSTSCLSDASTATDASMGFSPNSGSLSMAQHTTAHASTDMDTEDAAAEGGVAHQLVPVPLPVGSVRASLGALSTFEDCYALVRFLGTTFKDFQVNDQDMLMGVKMVSGFCAELRACLGLESLVFCSTSACLLSNVCCGR